jgi:MFS family permease
MKAAAERSRRYEMSGGIAIGVVSATLAAFFMGSTLLTPLYGLYEKAFGFSGIMLTLVYAVYVVGNLGALLFLGRLSDEIGRRRAALFALVMAGISTLLFLSAEDTAWLFGARMLSGFSIGIGAGTTTAWLAELYGARHRARATPMATGANMIGLALGPLLAGPLVQYAPWPLHLPYLIYLLALLVIGLLIWRTRETVEQRIGSFSELSLRPRLGVPKALRAVFLAPAVTVFGAMALIGFYAALIPGILVRNLHQTNHAVNGAVVGELFVAAAIAIFATQKMKSRTAMLGGLALLIPSLALLVTAQALGSMPILLIATSFGGISAALGYRGSLQVINQIAPPDRRAEVVSSYLMAGFSGNSLPIIGVGIISSLSGPMLASLVFAGTIAAFALIALVTGIKYIPKS